MQSGQLVEYGYDEAGAEYTVLHDFVGHSWECLLLGPCASRIVQRLWLGETWGQVSGHFKISWCTGESVSCWDTGCLKLLTDCGCEEAGAVYRVSQDLRSASKIANGLQLGRAGAQVQGLFRIYSLAKFGGLTFGSSQIVLRLAGAVSLATSQSTAWFKVWPVTQCSVDMSPSGSLGILCWW